MTEFTAKMVRNGMITVPSEVRETEGLSEGDFIRLKVLAKVGKAK